MKRFWVVREFHYGTEGWGLTTDGRALIMSDGSAFLYFMDPLTMSEVRRVQVHDSSGLVRNLNELEFIKGYVYANVWKGDEVVVISPDSGTVVRRIDLSGLMARDRLPGPEAVLNGIAFDKEGNRLFVTGKLWPKLFELQLPTNLP
jgi:glutamine cyclotransferase